MAKENSTVSIGRIELASDFQFGISGIIIDII